MLKSHSCGELRREDVSKTVTLAGWVDRRRDHGGLIFIDLRDREGIVQVVFNPDISPVSHTTASEARSEYVLAINGEVAVRPEGTENEHLPTGAIEVIASDCKILNTSETPPFYINKDNEVDENVRLRYRYLDLRRSRMTRNMILRHRVVKFIRDFLDAHGFIDVETPILIKSTPEGARDYLVPSRIHPGEFYALPQSPQQLKQLLMVAGIEKYYQIAKCFRDEDTRADRQPEFTQLDLEMSFADEDDILDLMEGLFTSLMEEIAPDIRITRPFPRISYAEVMARYGTDKPDIRYGLELRDISDLVERSEFSLFSQTIAGGGCVKGIAAPGCAGYSRHQLDELNTLAQSFGAGGLLTVALGDGSGGLDDLTMDKVRSVAARYLTLEQVKEIAGRFEAGQGDLLLIVVGDEGVVNRVLGELRQEMANRLNLADPESMAFAFVQDFPLMAWDGSGQHWEPMHHPFTSPVDDDIPLLDTAPGQVRGRHYDMVCNGYELGGGSIRIHITELQRKVFNLLGYPDIEVEERFGHMLEAFRNGAPPHGGIAFGIDRIVMLLAGEKTIREVIAFPKNQSAVDLTLNAPSLVSEEQLAELHLRIRED